ncbi:ROK family protein [Agromyces aureus]|uniref:ROK family transcriptional regulator n=1 Tax=Agromyces aureus TaxID=453304 RepID=A0A191WDI7_9MICO|nr:ROK family protein [Agromyces aureus]ANJ26335.1 ROK family transcriptional regulator [Agromyces aureus]
MAADELSPALGPGAAVLAFDVGGTDTKSALIDRAGRVLGLRRTTTPIDPADPAASVVSSLAELALAHLAERPGLDPVAVGISVPGIVDEADGIGVFASNFGWRDAPIRALGERALGLPVAFGHDVRAAGDAERRLGAARGYDDVVVLAIGTGIAGSILLGGRPLVGGGFAGEIGHSLADPHGDRCACGAIGCLETIASAGAIARRYTATSGIAVDGAREVLAAAAAGDAVAAAVWNDALDALADSIARLTATIAPQAVVIGGGLSQAGSALFGPLRERLDARLSFHRRPELVRARLGDDAGLLGTALAARDLADGFTARIADGGGS